MTLVRINHHPAFNGLFDQMFFTPARQTSGNGGAQANIINQDDAFLVELSVPGYAKEDISIKLEQQTLSIIAEPRNGEAGDNKYLRREFSLNGINRSFSVPKSVDTERISADFRDGILRITLPRKQEEIIRKEISIA